MKKFVLALLSTGILSGCAAGISTSEPVAKAHNITNICIDERKTGLNYTSKEIVEFIQTSLAKKNIASTTYKENKAQCKYVLKYSFKGKKELIVKGKTTLTELGENRTQLGEVGYAYRGDERDIAKHIGLKGQIDKIISELFKNYP